MKSGKVGTPGGLLPSGFWARWGLGANVIVGGRLGLCWASHLSQRGQGPHL